MPFLYVNTCISCSFSCLIVLDITYIFYIIAATIRSLKFFLPVLFCYSYEFSLLCPFFPPSFTPFFLPPSMPEGLYSSHQWPAANHWLIEATKGRNTVIQSMLQRCLGDQAKARLQLNLHLSPGSFPVLPHFLTLRGTESTPSIICTIHLRLCF